MRFILDCRKSNRFFADPPATHLITGEGLGDLEIEDGDFVMSGCSLYFGCGDVDSCFHRLKVPGWMSKYFCWEPIEAQYVGVSVVEGLSVSPTTLILPMQLTLPMGFSWATYIAQSVTSKKFEECIPPVISQPLSDISESKVLVCKQGIAAISRVSIA